MSEKKHKKDKQLSLPRPPVVVVLGHVDHGKTTILDYIRKTRLAEKESGKITQHIGACEINFNGQGITFIDTPGHEAFVQMRSHGAGLADMALLVIDINEGLKPQTVESLKIIKEAGLPYIIVLNKVDIASGYQAEAEIESQLKKHNVVLESWGGDVPLLKVSGKTGEGVEELLDTIIVLGVITENIEKNPEKKDFEGIIIESHLSSLSGIRAVMLIKQGSLKIGESLRSGRQIFTVKRIKNWQDKDMQKGNPSQPVTIYGFNESPELGEVFILNKSGKEKINVNNVCLEKEILIDKADAEDKDPPLIKIIFKTDVLGSQKAIINNLERLSKESGVKFLILYQGLGDISEFDIKLAQSSKAIILGFKIKTQGGMKSVAERLGVKIIMCDIIYDIGKELDKLIKDNKQREEKQLSGKLEILAVFRKREIPNNNKKNNKLKMIVGGELIEGCLKKNSEIEVCRNNKKIGKGKILELERDKKPEISIEEVGQKCGLLYEGNIEIKKGDTLITY